jgi:hypothetical protein
LLLSKSTSATRNFVAPEPISNAARTIVAADTAVGKIPKMLVSSIKGRIFFLIKFMYKSDGYFVTKNLKLVDIITSL